MPTEEETMQLGDHAERLLRDDGFNKIVEAVGRMISEEIISSPYADKDKREGLYMTYNGLRDFCHRLSALMQMRDEIIIVQEARKDGQYRSDDEG